MASVYLDPAQVVSYVTEERSAPLSVKVAAASAFLQEVLRLHDSTWTVKPYIDPLLHRRGPVSRKGRHDLMGDPIRYAELLWSGNANPDGVGYDGPSTANNMKVLVYYGVGTATDDSAASDAADGWRDAMEGEGQGYDASADTWTAPPGLLWALRRQHALSYTDSGGTAWRMEMAHADVQTGFAPADSANPDDRYECLFTLTLT